MPLQAALQERLRESAEFKNQVGGYDFGVGFVPFYMRSQVFTMPEFLERR